MKTKVSNNDATKIIAELFSEPRRTNREILAMKLILDRRYPGYELLTSLNYQIKLRGLD